MTNYEINLSDCIYTQSNQLVQMYRSGVWGWGTNRGPVQRAGSLYLSGKLFWLKLRSVKRRFLSKRIQIIQKTCFTEQAHPLFIITFESISCWFLLPSVVTAPPRQITASTFLFYWTVAAWSRIRGRAPPPPPPPPPLPPQPYSVRMLKQFHYNNKRKCPKIKH